MRQGTLLNKAIMLVLAAAVAVYLLASAWDSLNNPLATVISYRYASVDTVETTGFLVRQEVLIPSSGGTVERLPDEGERVARGQTVAMLYQNAAALARRQTIRQLELELDQLRYSLRRDDASRDSARLSQEVLESMAELRAATAAKQLTGLEKQAMSLRSLVYQREYTYGEAGSTETLEAAIQAREADLAALSAQSAADTVRVTAAQSGIFSGVVDGYEALLTPEGLSALTPSGLDALVRQGGQTDESAVGKLITDATWYFACALPEADAGRLYEGFRLPVRFSRDWSGEVEMTVESLGEPEHGRVAVVLSSNRFLSETTLLRRQTVELVFDTVEGIRIPKRAVRVESRTAVDSETGAETARQVTGVYVLVGAQAEFKPVTVLAEEEDYCLVRAETPEDGVRKTLRAGDEVIVTARDLFDGKVVQ